MIVYLLQKKKKMKDQKMWKIKRSEFNFEMHKFWFIMLPLAKASFAFQEELALVCFIISI